MCGIVFKYNRDGSPVNNDILQQFDKQRSRGVQGFGLFSYKNNKQSVVRDATEDGILKWLVKKDSPLIMFHHRFPTSTINVAEAAHPMTTHSYFGDTQYVLVHNGVIYNDDELFTKHQQLGIEYTTLLEDLSFNDSETLLWELALTLEGKQTEMQTRGDLAFICAKLVKGKLDTIYFGRDGRPLHYYRNKHTVELSSEGRGSEIANNRLYSYHYATNRLTKRNMKFTKPYVWNQNSSYVRSSQYDPYDYDEFYDYPTSWKKESDGVWRPRTEQRSPNQLEQIIRAKFPKLFDGETIDAVDLDMLEQRELADLEPSADEVQRRAMESLNFSDGNFETAYWILENEYSDLFELPDTIANVRERLLIEATLEFIQKDPEYKTNQSISSMWRNVCSQQQLAA